MMMPDIDKIIKAIKCRNGIDDTDSCTGCHYFVEEDNKLHHVYCNYQQLLNDVIDALELLKEKEAVLLKNQHKPYGISTNANSPWISRCPRCGKKVEGKQTRFCKYCGQAVKWDD